LVAELASKQAALSAIQGVLTARLLVTPSERASDEGGDRLLTAEEVARMLGVTKRWVQRRARRLPFSRRISVRSVRYSEAGLKRWMANRQIPKP
jgi:predicted DNA-binding transcriptional regulator AlpA